MRWHIRLFLFSLLAVSSLSGCIVMTDETVSETGLKNITDASLAQVKAGETTRAWLTAAFGAPTRAKRLDANKEILTYENTRDRTTEFKSMFLHVATSKDKIVKSTACFVLEDGVVSSCWVNEGPGRHR